MQTGAGHRLIEWASRFTDIRSWEKTGPYCSIYMCVVFYFLWCKNIQIRVGVRNEARRIRMDTAWEWYHFCETAVQREHHHSGCGCCSSTHWGYGHRQNPSFSRITGLLIRDNRYTDLLSLLHPVTDTLKPYI